MKHKFKVIQGTGNAFLGKDFEVTSLTKETLKEKFKQDFSIIQINENLFRCINVHITLVIKKGD